MKGLEDIVVAQPRILFVGINPSLRSGEAGHHFASPGNPFWRLLHASGLVPVLLKPEEDQRLAWFGLAMTNLCARPTRSAAELSGAELDRGVEILAAKVARMKPAVVAFVGLSVYQRFFHLKASGGAGPKPEIVAGARVFALPNPSGLNANFPGFGHKLVWFRALREFASSAAPPAG